MNRLASQWFLVGEGVDPKNASKKDSTTSFDMFRIENGKIAAHWDPAQRQ